MQAEDVLQLLTRNTAEVVTADEARHLAEALARGETRKGYIGFEPSGRVHLGWKVTADKVTDFVNAGLRMKILLADWHAQINDKLGGDLEKIKACGEYMKDCFAALGVPTDKVEFVYASDYVNDPDYWATVIAVSKHTSLARMRRAMDIMGRTAEEGERDMSKFLYPAMQVADIFHFGLDLAYGGLDQRHAHMLCRDVAAKLGKKPPVAMHTPLLPSLQLVGRMGDPGTDRTYPTMEFEPKAGIPAEDRDRIRRGQEMIRQKMSKSNPNSGILIHDAGDVVEKKINGAVCPQGQREGNPVLELVDLVVFRGHLSRDAPTSFVVERPEKFGGRAEFGSYPEVEAAFVGGKLHPMDLKRATAGYVNGILDGVRSYFAKKPQSLNKMRDLVGPW